MKFEIVPSVVPYESHVYYQIMGFEKNHDRKWWQFWKPKLVFVVRDDRGGNPFIP